MARVEPAGGELVSSVEELGEARRRARLPMPNWLEVIAPFCVIVALLVGWQLWVSVGHVPEYLWPTIPEVWDKLIHSGELLSSAWATLKLILTGLFFAILLGIALAGLVISVKPVEIGFYPIVVSTQFVPLIALAPLFVIWFGFGDTPQILIIMLFSYFPIFVSTLAGLRMIETEKMFLARATGAGRLRTFVSIRFPQALPQVFAGLKIGCTSAVIGAVVAEFTIGSRGIGAIILRATGFGDSTTLVAGVIYLGLLGAVLYSGVSVAERLAIPWSAAQRARSRKS